MKKLVIFFILFYNFLIAQELTLTLEQSIELGLKNSTELQIAESRILKSEASISEVSSSMLPKFSVNARYSRLSDVHPFQVDLPILPQPITIQETILDNYSIGANIEQPLFTGFKLSSIKEANQLFKEAEVIKYEKTKIDKIDNIQQSFWGYYSALQVTQLLRENLSALKLHLKNTNSLLNNGLVTKNDLLKIEVEVANLELNLLDAVNKSKLLLAAFNQSIGLPLEAETEIVTDTLSIESYSSDLNELINEAQRNRQEIKSLFYQVKALEKKESASKADWYPQLFAFGNFYFNNPNQRYLPLEDKFQDSWDLGVAMKWNIWDWGTTSAKVEQAKQDYLQADHSLSLLKDNINLDIYSKFLNLENIKKKIDISELQVISAEENYRTTKQKYYQQLSTSADLIDSEAALLKAKTSLITSKVEYKVGLFSLKKSLGRNFN